MVPPRSTFPARTFHECAVLMEGPESPVATHSAIVNGNVMKVFKDAPATMRQFWKEVTTQFSDKTYIVYESSERYTYGEAWALTCRLASIFRHVYGVHKGDRVAIVMRNLSEWLITYWATYLLGAVPVLVNALLPSKSIAFCITNTTCKLIILDGERAEQLASHLASIFMESGAEGVIVTKAHGGQGAWKKNSNIQRWDELLENYKSIDDHAWKKEPECSPEDDSSIFFTSGTTGIPKGVLSTQCATTQSIVSGFAGAILSALRSGVNLPLPEDDHQQAYLLPVPLFHVTGTCATVLPITAIGGKVVLMRKWDPKRAIDLIIEEEITGTGGVPSIVVDLIQAGIQKRLAESTNKIRFEEFGYGGAPPPPHLGDQIDRIFQTKVSNSTGYGLTETNAVAAGMSGRDSALRPLSVGQPDPTTQILIMDPKTCTSLPTGQAGEVWIRGPTVMKGYWKDPEATEKVLTSDGWFNSGDSGYIDEEGFLYINGRVKDTIIRGGENIDAVMIENALYRDERVLACSAVGVPDDRLGELPTAFVQPKSGAQVTEAELINVVKKHLPAFALPVMIVVLKHDEEFEKNAAGKILKEDLRKKALKEWRQRKSKHAVSSRL